MSKVKRVKIRLADGAAYSEKVKATGTVEDALAKLRVKYAAHRAVQAVTYTLLDGRKWTVERAYAA